MVFCMQCMKFTTNDRGLKFHKSIAYITQTSSCYTGWIQEGLWDHQRPQHQLLRDATVQECVKDRQVYQWCELLISDMTAIYKEWQHILYLMCYCAVCSHMQAHSLCLWLQNKYKENYTNHMKGHYEGGGIDKKTMHAMNVRKLASDVRWKPFSEHIISHM